MFSFLGQTPRSELIISMVKVCLILKETAKLFQTGYIISVGNMVSFLSFLTLGCVRLCNCHHTVFVVNYKIDYFNDRKLL